jgi:hypothetical protein
MAAFKLAAAAGAAAELPAGIAAAVLAGGMKLGRLRDSLAGLSASAAAGAADV